MTKIRVYLLYFSFATLPPSLACAIIAAFLASIDNVLAGVVLPFALGVVRVSCGAFFLTFCFMPVRSSISWMVASEALALVFLHEAIYRAHLNL